MTEEIRIKCPKHHGGNGDFGSYFFNTDKGVGSCFSCGLTSWVGGDGNLYGREDKSKKVILLEKDFSEPTEDCVKEDLEEYMTEDPMEDYEFEYTAIRGIRKDIKEFFDIRTYKKVPWKAYNKETDQWENGVSDEEHAIYP